MDHSMKMKLDGMMKTFSFKGAKFLPPYFQSGKCFIVDYSNFVKEIPLEALEKLNMMAFFVHIKEIRTSLSKIF